MCPDGGVSYSTLSYGVGFFPPLMFLKHVRTCPHLHLNMNRCESWVSLGEILEKFFWGFLAPSILQFNKYGFKHVSFVSVMQYTNSFFFFFLRDQPLNYDSKCTQIIIILKMETKLCSIIIPLCVRRILLLTLACAFQLSRALRLFAV